MDLSASMLCLDDSVSPDKTVSMLLDVYSGWRDQGREMSPELLTSIFQEVSLNKTPKKEIPVNDDCEVVLSDFSTLLKVVNRWKIQSKNSDLQIKPCRKSWRLRINRSQRSNTVLDRNGLNE